MTRSLGAGEAKEPPTVNLTEMKYEASNRRKAWLIDVNIDPEVVIFQV